MKVLVLYRPRSEHRSVVEEFVRMYKSQYPNSSMEILDVDQPDGSTTAALYDFMTFPTVAVLRADGGIVQSWEGQESLPSTGDVNYFASSQL